MSNTSIIMMKNNQENVDLDKGTESAFTNTKPAFEFQLIEKPGLSFFASDKMPEMDKLGAQRQLLSKPMFLNIFQW